VAAVLKHLAPPPEGGHVAILDPCCGKGAALRQLAVGLNCSPAGVYGIELHEGRGREAEELLAGCHVLPNTDFMATAISPFSFSLAWVNPPFDDELGGGGRVERQFLQRATELLKPGGILCLVAPENVVRGYDMVYHLTQWYDRVGVLDFPVEHRKFRESVCMGVKRQQPQSGTGYQTLDRIEHEACTTYQIPSGHGPRRCVKANYTQQELGLALAQSPLRKLLEVQAEGQMAPPPLELGTGHTAMLVASGCLDGLIEPPGEPPIVIAGHARKVDYLQDTEEVENEDGSTTTKQVFSQKICLEVAVLEADGKITRFSQE
jgi:hypothetical protein